MSNRLVPFPGTFDQREERTVMVPVARLVLRTTAGPLRGQQYMFDGGVFVIGRAPTCTVSIPSQAVSRAHARIEYANGGYWIIPEKTVNGTRVNGNLVNEPTQLADKDKIAIDDSAFVVSCRTPGEEDLDFEDLAPAPAMAKGSQVPQREAPPYGRDSVTAMSQAAPPSSPPTRPSLPAMQPPPMTAPYRPSMQEIPVEPRYSAQISTAQVAGQIEARALPERSSGPQLDGYRPSSPGFMYGAPPPYPYYPPPPPQPQRSRAGVWFFAGIGVLAVIVVVVVVTVKLVAPPPQQPAPAPAPTPPPPVAMKVDPASAPPVAPVEAPKPAPVEVAKPAPVEAAKPAPVEPEKPAPAPAATTAVLTIETTPVTTESRGTIVDVGKVGATVKRDGGVGHVRLYSANFEAAAAKLAALQKKYGTSEEYADFIAEAKQDYVIAARRREIKLLASDAPGTVTKVKVKAGDEVRPNQVIAELAVARITVPVEAVDGTGKKCTADLPAKKSVKGTLLPAGSTERTIELDAVPKDLAPGELGDVKIHCP